MREIYVAISMDCEPPNTTTHHSASGPASYQESELFIRHYVAIAADHGFPVSFFIHPEVALNQGDLFTELEESGACLGLHLHPWKFDPSRYPAHLGLLNAEQQRAAISEAAALWHHAFGRRPLYFRPGTFSASDSTFEVLVELGFRGGSVSIPGRVWKELGAVWPGAIPDPHRPHHAFRLLEGDLEFANIPMSVDLSAKLVDGDRIFFRDLRPDYESADYAETARNIVQQLLERQPEIPVITLVTHNDNDYSNPENRNRRHYESALREIRAACEEKRLVPVGTTIGKICDLVLQQEKRYKEFVYV